MVYRRMLDMIPHRLASLLGLAADSDGPVLVHCAAGMRPGARGLTSKSVWLQAGTSYWLHLGGWGERALGFFHLGTGFWLM